MAFVSKNSATECQTRDTRGESALQNEKGSDVTEPLISPALCFAVAVISIR